MAKFSVCGLIAIALLAILLIVEAKPADKSTDRIISGERAKIGQFPHQVSIRQFRGRTHFCGGVILSDRFVLTTAKCMQDTLSFPSNVIVVVGTISLSSGYGTIHTVTRIANHPDFSLHSILNDISVIKTVEKIAFSNAVRAIKLPTANTPDGTAATISGWGLYVVSSIDSNIFCLSQYISQYHISRWIVRWLRMSYYSNIRSYWHESLVSNVWVIWAAESTQIRYAPPVLGIEAYVGAILVAHSLLAMVMYLLVWPHGARDVAMENQMFTHEFSRT